MSLGEEIAAALGAAAVSELRPLQGGGLSEVVRADLADGDRVVVKIGDRAAREAAMLRAMAEAGAPVPGVLAVTPRLLMLEWLPPSPAGREGWTSLAHRLRHMHETHGSGYGWPEDDSFGPVAIANRTASDWPEFWETRRLQPLAGPLPAATRRMLDDLCARLPEYLPSTPLPGLLHGDLWTGNVHESRGMAYMIDPACYHGHGEVDLAMLHLFGTPPTAFSDAYGALEPGWQERRAIYQLWPALVHLHLFGSGYLGMVERLLRSVA